MKKFMKGAAVTGGLFLFIGLVVIIIGALGGGIKEMIRNRTALSKAFDRIEIWDGIDFSFGKNGYGVFEKGQKKYSSGVYTIENVDASELIIKVGAGSLKVKYHDEPTVKLEIGNNDKMQCFVEGNALNIRGGVDDNISFNSNMSIDSEMTVYLPKEKMYQKVLFDVGAGSLGAEALNGEEIEINAGAGYVNIADVDVNNLELKVGMGEIKMAGNVNNNVTVDCGMGQVCMKLSGTGKDFDYDLDCGIGSLDIDGVYEISGIGNQNIENSAEKEMEISVGIGSVEVEFEE